MQRFQAARAAWAGEAGAGGGEAPAWPRTGIAIEGDFSGIQRFVLRPVPGSQGAARRLRARSFRVLALTRLVATAVVERLGEAGAREYYCAGGRFLVVTNPFSQWKDRLVSLQADLDMDLLNSYHGELVFHLAGAEFNDGRIPLQDLRAIMAARNQNPLGKVLCTDQGWATDRFFFTATQHEKCDGCGATAKLAEKDDDEQLCQTCVDDRELGKALLGGGRTALIKSPNGSIVLLGQRWALSRDGGVQIPIISHAPAEEHGENATFETLAKRAAGRQYLGYLRMDADRIGNEFSKLCGDPRRVWGLSTLLDSAFSAAVANLMRTRHRNLYPVYGGGDDLFVIGPWNEVLDFAAEWRENFRSITEDQLTFSAGIALAKPRQHILSKSEEAERALNYHAKGPRDSIHALSCTISWADFPAVLAGAKELAKMQAQKQIRSALLHNIIDLHTLFRNGDARWHSLLFYQVERNVTGNAKDFVKHKFLSPGALWKHADFVARYAELHKEGLNHA